MLYDDMFHKKLLDPYKNISARYLHVDCRLELGPKPMGFSPNSQLFLDPARQYLCNMHDT